MSHLRPLNAYNSNSNRRLKRDTWRTLEPVRMPTKRYHKKSRAGCDTCKRRRVKCDEATPTCGTCTQRGDPCTYTQSTVTTARSRQRTRQFSSTTTLSAASPLPLTPTSCSLYNGPSSRLASYNATRMKEMQLMHRWSTVTYLKSGPRNMEVFRDYAVRMSLEYTYLMDILLAFTSLHSASEAPGPTHAHEHVAAALHYQNQSIADFNKEQSLINISKETIEPVLLVTGLNAVTALVASLVPVTSGEQLETIPEILLRVRKYMFGINDIIEQHRAWVENSEFSRIFESPTVRGIEEGGSFTVEKVRTLSDAILANMDLDDTESPFYRNTLEKLEKAYADNKGRSVVSWLVMVEPDFFHKVDMRETAAMVILVCWGAITFVLEDVWWTKYSGRRIVEELSSQLRVCDVRWDEILRWCYEQVGVCSKSTNT